MFGTMLETAVSHDCDVVICDCMKDLPDKNALFTQNIAEGFYDRAKLETEYFPKLLMQSDLTYPPAISNCLMLIRSELIRENNLRYPAGIRISEDLFFGACVMYRAQKFYYLKNKAFYHYFVANTGSATKKSDTALWDNYERLLDRLHEEFGNRTDFDFSEQLGHTALFFALNTIGQTAGYAIPLKDKSKIADRVAKSSRVKAAMKTVGSLTVPAKLKCETMLLGSPLTARVLMKYLTDRK